MIILLTGTWCALYDTSQSAKICTVKLSFFLLLFCAMKCCFMPQSVSNSSSHTRTQYKWTL